MPRHPHSCPHTSKPGVGRPRTRSGSRRARFFNAGKCPFLERRPFQGPPRRHPQPAFILILFQPRLDSLWSFISRTKPLEVWKLYLPQPTSVFFTRERKGGGARALASRASIIWGHLSRPPTLPFPLSHPLIKDPFGPQRHLCLFPTVSRGWKGGGSGSKQRVLE